MSVYGDHTHYDTLEVDEAASQDIIDSAYQYLCHKWHPSRHPEGRSHGERKLVELHRAYRVISKPRARAEYDAWLAEQRTAGGGGKAVFGDTPSALMPVPPPEKLSKESPPEADFSEVIQSISQPTALETAGYADPSASFELPEGYEYAGLWERAAALFADGLVVWLLNFLLGFVVGFLARVLGQPFPQESVFWFVGAAAGSIYYTLGWSSKKMATPGKAAMGIEVRTEAFGRLSPDRAFLRTLVWSIGALFFFVTYITQPFTKKRQCLHDMAVRSVVLRNQNARRSPLLLGAIIFLSILSVTGILAAIALPTYQEYTQKAKVASAYLELEAAMRAVNEHDRRGGYEPANLKQVGFYPSKASKAYSGPTIYSDEESFFIHVDFDVGGRLAVFSFR